MNNTHYQDFMLVMLFRKRESSQKRDLYLPFYLLPRACYKIIKLVRYSMSIERPFICLINFWYAAGTFSLPMLPYSIASFDIPTRFGLHLVVQSRKSSSSPLKLSIVCSQAIHQPLFLSHHITVVYGSWHHQPPQLT